MTEAQAEALLKGMEKLATLVAGSLVGIAEAANRIAAALEADKAKAAAKKASRKPGELEQLEERFLEAWNGMAKNLGLSPALVLTGRDRRNLADRLNELKRRFGTDDEAFEKLVGIMQTLKDQPFALGRVTGKKWKIDIHKFLTAEKFAAVEAGSYGEKTGHRTETDGSIRDDSLFGDD